MDKLIQEVKERKYDTKEFIFDEESGVKGVESIPLSAVNAKNRKTVSGLDDLKVCCRGTLANNSAQESCA